MTLRERVATVMMVHVAGTDPAAVAAEVATLNPGGLIFMGDNVGATTDDVASLAAAVQDPELPRLLAVDQEGGVVSRLPGDTFPAGSALAGASPADVTAAFAARGGLVAASGLNVNFGVVADVTDDPGSFIASRILGATPNVAGPGVAAAVRGEATTGVLSTLKHFPGHGAAPGDSHSSLPETAKTLAEWQTSDAVPFQQGIEAGAEIVMLGHLVYSSVDDAPASLSARWHEILRDDLGFEGLAISDDLGMLENSGIAAYTDRVDNAIAALSAGTSMLLFVADSPTSVPPAEVIDGLVAAVEDGRLPEATLNDAALRVIETRIALSDN